VCWPFEAAKAILCLFRMVWLMRGAERRAVGEQRVLSHVVNLRSRPCQAILEAVFNPTRALPAPPANTTTVQLVLLNNLENDSGFFSDLRFCADVDALDPGPGEQVAG